MLKESGSTFYCLCNTSSLCIQSWDECVIGFISYNPHKSCTKSVALIFPEKCGRSSGLLKIRQVINNKVASKTRVHQLFL